MAGHIQLYTRKSHGLGDDLVIAKDAASRSSSSMMNALGTANKRSPELVKKIPHPAWTGESDAAFGAEPQPQLTIFGMCRKMLMRAPQARR